MEKQKGEHSKFMLKEVEHIREIKSKLDKQLNDNIDKSNKSSPDHSNKETEYKQLYDQFIKSSEQIDNLEKYIES
jgi:hypothetical protein